MRGQFQLRAMAILILALSGVVALRSNIHCIGTDRPLALGRFHPASHKGYGVATVYQRANGTYLLQLNGLHTTDRPDLLLFVISLPDAFDNETVLAADQISLGSLPISGGDQTYALPAKFDPTRYSAVTVWSPKYQVNFTTAALKPLGVLSRLKFSLLAGLDVRILTAPAGLFRPAGN